MSLQFNYRESINDGIKRVLMEELKEAIGVITNYRESDPHLAIHEARKSMKKIRSVYRLIRYEIDDYSEKNTFYRDLARSISDIRDATSTIEALHLLKQQYEDNLYKNAFNDLEKHLMNKKEEISKELLEDADVLSSIKEALENKVEEVSITSFNLNGFDSFGKGLHKVYQRGRKGLEHSIDQPSTENFHEWRKRAKYLRYHLQILERIWPAIMDEMEDELHEITDLLGHDHDLSMIDEIVKSEAGIFDNDSDRSLFNGLVREQRENLQFHAIRMGEKFYFDDPDYFVSRLKAYWDSHTKELQKKEVVELDELEY